MIPTAGGASPRRESHLFLDLDGTVTDSRDGIVRCLSHALRKLGKPIPADDALQGFIGSPLARVFEVLLGSTDERAVSSAIAIYRERFSSIGILENRVYPDIPSTRCESSFDRAWTSMRVIGMDRLP